MTSVNTLEVLQGIGDKVLLFLIKHPRVPGKFTSPTFSNYVKIKLFL